MDNPLSDYPANDHKRSPDSRSRPIYLDFQGTTPLDEAVFSSMHPFFAAEFGNPHSMLTSRGAHARNAIAKARREIAALLGTEANTIVFTSGATESNNLALQGLARKKAGDKWHLIVSAIEHSSVMQCALALQKQGVDVSIAPVTRDGIIDPAGIESLFQSHTALVSVMAVNNEIGTIQPFAAIGAACRERGVLFHSDMAQAAGTVPLNLSAAHVDLASISGHKIYGPAGIGALYIRNFDNPPIEALFFGGGQEAGLRSGTLPTPLCVGFGTAALLVSTNRAADEAHLRRLRAKLINILADIQGFFSNGHPEMRIAGNLNFGFEGVSAERLLSFLPKLDLSTVSACLTAKQQNSHVLRAIGQTPERAACSLRLGLGRSTTDADVETAAGLIQLAVVLARSRSK
jgi:cysteine desulfurase